MPAIGQAIARVDGPAKVTGETLYGADVCRPDMLWGAMLRSPLPHARIVSIDTGRARALPGVQAVLTGLDLPDVRVGRRMRDMPVLARERVRFVGEKVAAVAAADVDTAEEALGLIQIDYEELPAVFDPLEAMRDDAPLLHEDVAARKSPEQRVPQVRNGVAEHAWGASLEEVEAALQSAAHLFQHAFRAPLMHQAYIEPHACLVEIDQAGRVHVWASQKAPFLLFDYLREGLGLPQERVEFHMLTVGGDFGGKGSLMDIPLAYFLAEATGRPVKLVMSYSEELLAGNPRHSAEVTIRTGVGNDGRLLARHLEVVFDSGAYAAFRPDPRVILPATRMGVGLYHIPVARIDSVLVYTNTVPRGHMRNPGGPQTLIASECQLDLIARELGLDPLELRLRNAPHPGQSQGAGGWCHSPKACEVLEVAARELDWGSPKSVGVGRGVVLMDQGVSVGVYSAEVIAETDGRAVLHTPIVDCGPGAHTVLKQIVADELAFPYERVEVVPWVRDLPYDRGVGGARVTRLSGEAARRATAAVRERLLEAAAEALGLPPSQLRIEDGRVVASDGRSLEADDVVRFSGGAISEQVQYQSEVDHDGQAFMAQAVEVEVDAETGQLRVRRVVSVHDTGIVVNPTTHQGQIEGGIVQGLGYAVMEELRLQDGKPVNPNLGEYRIPACPDIPQLKTVLLEPEVEAGFKPASEGHNTSTPAAIACAALDALGALPQEFPLTSERLLEALKG